MYPSAGSFRLLCLFLCSLVFIYCLFGWSLFCFWLMKIIIEIHNCSNVLQEEGRWYFKLIYPQHKPIPKVQVTFGKTGQKDSKGQKSRMSADMHCLLKMTECCTHRILTIWSPKQDLLNDSTHWHLSMDGNHNGPALYEIPKAIIAKKFFKKGEKVSFYNWQAHWKVIQPSTQPKTTPTYISSAIIKQTKTVHKSGDLIGKTQ